MRLLKQAFSHWGAQSPPPILFFFQKFTQAQIEKIEKDLEQERCEDEKDKILCKVCQHPITSFKNKIDVNGQHRHIFSNPVGISYEVGCFSSANGCVNKGNPTFDFTWFNGFAWRFALCSNCLSLLGWFYQSESDSFYGLILEHLDDVV
jgi:hypothetical protein